MNSFTNQIAETQAQLDRLRNLFAQHPELFDTANLIEVTPEHCRVYLHASRDRVRDWKEFARQYPKANWKRESSASDYAWMDYRGQIGDVEISILQAELREQPHPLFAAQEVA